jgi:hypothetical protein
MEPCSQPATSSYPEPDESSPHLPTLLRRRHMLKNDIKMDLKQDVTKWSGFMWFRIGTSGGLGHLFIILC